MFCAGLVYGVCQACVKYPLQAHGVGDPARLAGAAALLPNIQPGPTPQSAEGAPHRVRASLDVARM